MGHTRMTTQGSAKRNGNNHPFTGTAGGTAFALAHNGVLYNDKSLRKQRDLPGTDIETDSYVAVQLIEKEGALSPDSLKHMAELVEGSFVFTVLEQRNTLHFVKGDNPLCILHFLRWKLYVYASTEEILKRALGRTRLAAERSVRAPVEEGEIVSITERGTLCRDRFEPRDRWSSPWARGWHVPSSCPPAGKPERWYIQQLKGVAASFGYAPEQIDALLREGWSTDEIEDTLYCWEEF